MKRTIGISVFQRYAIVFGLQERKKQLPNQLSGGQQQRVAIGRALMNAPAFMLADEPTGSLDSQNGHEIIRMLKSSHEKYRQTLIIVTHDENIALQADRICVSRVPVLNNWDRLKALTELLWRGFAGQIVLGHDITDKTRGVSYGYTGFTGFIRNAIPTLKELGFEAEIQKMMVENPARILAYKNCAISHKDCSIELGSGEL